MALPEKTYRCTIEVRGYELDSYGHVNHAQYLSYFEHARWKMLEQENLTLEIFKGWKRWPIVAGLEIKYVKPAFMGDQLEVVTTVAERGRIDFKFDQELLRGGVLVAKARIHGVMIDERGKLARIPEEMKFLGTVSK